MVGHQQGASWFLAQLKPNSTQIADRNLKRQGFETFLPLLRETRRTGARFTHALKPLFVGYIFFAVTPEGPRWDKVRSTFGVSRVVAFGEGPQQVDGALIADLAGRCDGDGVLQPPKEMAPGDEVTITEGPFAAFTAKVLTLAPDQRVWVLLDLLGQQSRVALSTRQVRRV
jgi:Transcription antiterminator